MTAGVIAGTTLGIHAATESLPLKTADENKNLITYIMEHKSNTLWHDAKNHKYYKVTEYKGAGSTGLQIEMTLESGSSITYIDTNNDGIPDQILSAGNIVNVFEMPMETQTKATKKFQDTLGEIKELMQNPQ